VRPIRIATPADFERVYWHLLEYFTQDCSLGVPASLVKGAREIRALCNGKGGVVAIIETDDGQIVASVAVRARQLWYAEQYYLGQVWLYVSPGSRRDKSLYDALFRWLDEHRKYMSAKAGYDMVLENTVLSGHRLAAKARLWGRYGKQIGAVFWSRGGQ